MDGVSIQSTVQVMGRTDTVQQTKLGRTRPAANTGIATTNTRTYRPLQKQLKPDTFRCHILSSNTKADTI